MKNAVRLLALLVAVVVMSAAPGCAKKCVIPDEPIAPPPPPEVMPEITEPLETETPGRPVDLGTIYFDFDRSEIRKGDAGILEANAGWFKAAAEAGGSPQVTIEGHCDPLGTAEYNVALGQRRAEAAKAFLVGLGVPASQLSCVSYGEEKLVTTEKDEYELNRRAEFKVGE